MHKSLESVLNGNIKLIEDQIGYEFKEKKHIILALTHSSYANENKNEGLSSNERLEFLGDAILNIVISEYIYNKFIDLAEGELTKARAGIVCEGSLMKCANGIGLGKYLLLGRGEELTGGRNRTSILSDAFEALIAAIYLDGGLDDAKKFIHSVMKEILTISMKGFTFDDYKTQLQEFVQKSGDRKIQYEILEEKGPDHNKLFIAQVKVAESIMGKGEGKTKKEAEQNAAKIALTGLQESVHA